MSLVLGKIQTELKVQLFQNGLAICLVVNNVLLMEMGKLLEIFCFIANAVQANIRAATTTDSKALNQGL